MKENIVRRYIKYKAAQGRIAVEEAARRSMAHAFTILNNPEISVAILTAFRTNDYQLPINRVRNQDMERRIQQFGYGYFPVLGVWNEIKEDGSEPELKEEESFFVQSRYDAPTRFRQNILTLVQEFDQDAALIKYAGEDFARYLDNNGSEAVAGEFSLNRLAEYYTQMKKGPPNRRFTFEAAASLSNMTQKAIQLFEKGNPQRHD